MKSVLAGVFVLAAVSSFGRTLTLPAVANVFGQALFQTDVRVFNPSYTATITVTAKYHYCQGGTCNHEKDETITVSPREAKAFNDIAVSLFALANTQGAIEFETDAADLVVTSRLYSNSLLCQGSVGQFVPGLDDEDAYPINVLTSLQQNADFRTNIVMFNPSSSVSLPVMVQVFDGDSGSQIGSNFTTTLGPEEFFPSSNLFTLVGATSSTSSNAYAKVTGDGTHGVFVAASVLDNHSQDTIFIKGELDTTAPPPQVPQASFTFSPSSPTAGQPVQFTDTSTGFPTSWMWAFGDGGSSTQQNPTHTYATAGNFPVSHPAQAHDIGLMKRRSSSRTRPASSLRSAQPAPRRTDRSGPGPRPRRGRKS